MNLELYEHVKQMKYCFSPEIGEGSFENSH